MNEPQTIAADILCLGHTSTKLEWCERIETCKRHRDIGAKAMLEGFSVLFRVCRPGEHDQYIETP